MKKSLLLILVCQLWAMSMMAQRVDTSIKIIDSNVHSLRVAPFSNAYVPPVIVMGSDNKIEVSFDYFDYDVHYLRYSVTHCNADWQPSQLVESEYVDGFNYGDIEEHDFSEATFVNYVHYSFALPNDEFVITKSGNYLLKVYEQDDPDKVLFQTRFSVCEHLVDVMATVTTQTDVDFNGEHQQLAVEVGYKQGVIADPYRELMLVVGQNTRTDIERVVSKPMMVEMGKVTYDHIPQLIFPAGNEYRRMETVNVHSLNMGIASIKYFEPYNHATVYTDEPRVESQYLYDQTQYGHFTIRNSETHFSATEADYLVTHFSLNTGGPLNGGKLYLDGEFTQGLPETARLMKYDPSTGCYTNDMLLKQGAYNYQYLWVPDGTKVGLTSKIEGDKYQTINQYNIKVFNRPMGERYDRFVGYGIAYSGK